MGRRALDERRLARPRAVLLRRVKEQGLVAKTGIMVGIGEKDEEVLALMDDVQAGSGGCDILTTEGNP